MNLDAFDDGGRQVLIGARRAALAAHDPHIGSGHLLLACLDDAGVADLLRRHGLDVAGARRALPTPAPDRDLLAAIGIDVDVAAVRERARAMLGDERRTLCLRRRRSRPLHVVFEGEGRRLRFSETGRKVLEVATWRAKGSPRPDWRLRRQRPVTAVDLLAGILSDGRDPTRRLLHRHGLRVGTALHAELFGTERA